jgi:hypothetical protein
MGSQQWLSKNREGASGPMLKVERTRIMDTSWRATVMQQSERPPEAPMGGLSARNARTIQIPAWTFATILQLLHGFGLHVRQN